MNTNSYRVIIRNVGGSLSQISTGTTSDTQVLHHMHYDRTNLGVAVDGGTLQTSAANLGDIAIENTGLNIGRAPANSFYINGTIQEILVWNADQSSNRSGIETDINNYFSIY